MKRLLVSLSCLLAGLPALAATDTHPVTFYVQLVRGTDDDKPPAPEARRVGPKLSKTFQPVFRWNHYWEITRKEVALTGGQKTRVRLSPHREVDIGLTKSGKRSVTAYSDGKQFYCDTRPTGKSITIIGGERDARNSWFIVVRRDKPSD